MNIQGLLQQAQPVHPEIFISFIGPIDFQTTQGLLATVGQYVNNGTGRVNLLLTTPGGMVPAGVAAYHALRALPATVITWNTGSINSIGNVLYLAGQERYATPNSSFMFHGVGLDVQGNQIRLDEKVLSEKLEQIKTDTKIISGIIQERTQINPYETARLFLREAYVPASKAKEKGLVDDVRDVKVPPGAPFLQLVFR